MSSSYLHEEPPIEEMLADPIVRLVMQRDRIGPREVRAALDAARRRLGLRSSDRAADAGDCILPSCV